MVLRRDLMTRHSALEKALDGWHRTSCGLCDRRWTAHRRRLRALFYCRDGVMRRMLPGEPATVYGKPVSGSDDVMYSVLKPHANDKAAQSFRGGARNVPPTRSRP